MQQKVLSFLLQDFWELARSAHSNKARPLLCTIQDSQKEASFCAPPRLSESTFYQNVDAYDHCMKVMEEEYRKIFSINLTGLFRISHLPASCLSPKELHNVFRSISSFYEREFNLLSPFLQESNHKFQWLDLTLKCKQHQNYNLTLLAIFQPNEPLLFLFQSKGCLPIQKTFLNCSMLIIHVSRILLLCYPACFYFFFRLKNHN